jgi:AraC family transcriptional regulator of adaptative response / methylphosphotriester-DNA alkyltransferase methyltransferase
MVARAAAPPPRPAHREATSRYLAELYLRAHAIVGRHYRRPLTLPVVARALAASPRQVQRAYAEIGQTSFAAHLRAVRLGNAAELLARQPLTVADVARLVGYGQPSHFVKAFRRRYGMTPGAFREAARRRAALDARARGRRGDGARRSTPPGRGAQTSRVERVQTSAAKGLCGDPSRPAERPIRTRTPWPLPNPTATPMKARPTTSQAT